VKCREELSELQKLFSTLDSDKQGSCLQEKSYAATEMEENFDMRMSMLSCTEPMFS